MRHLSFLALAAAMTATVLLAARGLEPAAAHEPHPGLEFSISVPGVDGCDTTAGDATCSILLDSSFPVQVRLDSLGDIPSYLGFDIFLGYEGVAAKPGSANMAAWPDCEFPASNYMTPGIVAMACAIGIPPAPPSTHTGVIGRTSFVCDKSGEVSLLHGEGNTDLVEDLGMVHKESTSGRETLAVTCSPCPSGGVPNEEASEPGGATAAGEGKTTVLPPTFALPPTATPVDVTPPAPESYTCGQEPTATAVTTQQVEALPFAGANGDDDDRGWMLWSLVAGAAAIASGAAIATAVRRD